MALENSPPDARGLMSGILQQGYSFGYVCAACANLGVGGGVETWKTIFWIAAGLSIGVGLIRMAFPESQQFIEARKAGKKAGGASHFWYVLCRRSPYTFFWEFTLTSSRAGRRQRSCWVKSGRCASTVSFS